MTLKSAFKSVYGELLSPYGYTYCAKLDRFVKVVNQEVIHCVGLTAKNYYAKRSGYKAFSITGVVLSIYYPYVEKTHINTLARHLRDYTTMEEALRGFEYREDDVEEVLRTSFGYVEQHMLPVMEKVVDYSSYIDYQIRINNDLLTFANQFKFDSLVLIATDNHNDFMNVIDEYYFSLPEEAKNPKSYEAMRRVMRDYITKPRDEVFDNPELLSKALEEAERRKEKNLAQLKSLKLI